MHPKKSAHYWIMPQSARLSNQKESICSQENTNIYDFIILTMLRFISNLKFAVESGVIGVSARLLGNRPDRTAGVPGVQNHP